MRTFKKIKFKFLDKFSLRKTKKSFEEKVFEKGSGLVKNELNMINLIQVLKKIKAAVTILVNTHPNTIGEIQHLYLKNSTIITDERAESYVKD